MTKTHARLVEVTERIIARSDQTRRDFLDRIAPARKAGRASERLSCGNFAHAIAAGPASDKILQRSADGVNIGIVTAYNDMLSAHQPFADYPDIIKDEARRNKATAQVAGGVPAMCDGVTQGRGGMELSLFSRDVIALSTALALSHDAFDGVLALGVCDKIVPGLVMGALSFGHLPLLLVPAGPMPSGLPNKEKSAVRALFAEGKIGRAELLDAESASYHGPGTCTFYGTANSNQMLMEMMGLHIPGAAFGNPGTPLREALTRQATRRAVELARQGHVGLADMLDARAFVNGIVGLMATGGSTNHALHIPAMAAAAGYRIDWDDLADISAITPLLTRIYPNGDADVNQFHAAGGMALLCRELSQCGLLHQDVLTVAGRGIDDWLSEPFLIDGQIERRAGVTQSLERDILRGTDDPFDTQGGLKVLTGNLGRSIIKVSAVAQQHRVVEAPAIIFEDQAAFVKEFQQGNLNRDFIAVLRFQGPGANGMPELHSLSPALGVLMDRGFKVALVTDGRMSGASGKTPAALHVTPEANVGGPIARLRNGDVIRLDADVGTLNALIDENEFAARESGDAPAPKRREPDLGRHLFRLFRGSATSAESGGGVLDL